MRKMKRIVAGALGTIMLLAMANIPVKAADTLTDPVDVREETHEVNDASVSENLNKLREILQEKGYVQFEVNHGVEKDGREYGINYADGTFIFFNIMPGSASVGTWMTVTYESNEIKSAGVNLFVGTEKFADMGHVIIENPEKYNKDTTLSFVDVMDFALGQEENDCANKSLQDSFELWEVFLETECSMTLADVGFSGFKKSESQTPSQLVYNADCGHVDKAPGGKWDGTSYTNPNGQKVVNAFFSDGTYTYFLDAYGNAMKDKLTYHPDGVHVIYFDENGHEVFSNFAHVKKSIAGTAVDDYCFFDVYGHLYVDVMTYDVTGKKLYYINPYGQIERNGWFKFSSTAVWAGTTKKVGTGWGYGQADGTLMINKWTKNKAGKKVYMQGDGHMK